MVIHTGRPLRRSGRGPSSAERMNTIWAVPRQHRPIRLRRVAEFVAARHCRWGVARYHGVVGDQRRHGRVRLRCQGRRIGRIVAVNAVAFTLAFRIGTDRHLTVGQVVPGALTAALGWQLLQSFGAVYVGQRRSRALARRTACSRWSSGCWRSSTSPPPWSSCAR